MESVWGMPRLRPSSKTGAVSLADRPNCRRLRNPRNAAPSGLGHKDRRERRAAVNVEAQIEQIRRTLQNLEDRQAILDCLVREARGRDRHDAAMTASCYWDDGA